jgi:hypothetical protein
MSVNLECIGGNDSPLFQQEAVEVVGKEQFIHEIFEIGYLIGFHRFLFYLSFWFLLFRFGMAASFYFSLLEYMKSIKIARVFKDGKVKIDFRGKTENPLYNKQLIVLS